MVAYQSGNKKNLKELFTDEQIQQMREELENCVSHCDEKVSLAVLTYDLVRSGVEIRGARSSS